MGSDRVNDGRDSRRRKYEDGQEEYRHGQERTYHDECSEKHGRRYRSREREKRRRSRSPDSRDRRSRSRDRERRDRQRDREVHDERISDVSRGGERSRRERDRRQYGGSERRSGKSEHKREENEATNSDQGRDLVKRRGPLPSQGDSFAISKGEEPEKPVEKPNFGNTGLLAAASNTVTQADGSTVALKYHEPPEARKPSPRDIWKLFVFKGADIIDTVELSTRSCWLIGRDTAVVDLPAEHPSISKQHAVIQFRYTEKRNEYGDKIGRVKPYLIDLESGNGTLLNNEKVPESRYLELRDKDMIQFGSSTREYVLMLAPKD